MPITPIDKTKETSGIEQVYYGVTLKIARENNTNFKHLFRTLISPHKYQMENNSVPEEVSEDIMLKCYARAILVGWEDYNDSNGKAIVYSEKEAYKLLKEDEDVYVFVQKQSKDMNLFIRKEEADTKGK